MDVSDTKNHLLPLSHPHVCGQCILNSNIFSFFGGYVDEISLAQHINKNNGKIYSFSTDKPDQIYESNLDTLNTQIIASTTVFNEEIGLSFTFGGLSYVYDETTQTFEKIPTSNIYAFRWVSPLISEGKYNNDLFHKRLSKKQISDNSINIVDDIFNIEEGFSGIFNLQKSNQMFTPSLSKQKPSPRCFHSAIWDSINNLMWVFGGLTISSQGKKEYLNDTWVWSLYTGMWYKIEVQNPPKPRIGSSMTFLNGIIYLFGGYSPNYSKSIFKNNQSSIISDNTNTNNDMKIIDDSYHTTRRDQENYYFYKLDISSVTIDRNNHSEEEISKFNILSWQPISKIPKELIKKLFGATILPYSPTRFQSYIIFSGGSLSNRYDMADKFSDSSEIVADLAPMSLVSYNVQSGEFRVHPPVEHIPEVSFHSAALSACGVLHIVGGISASVRNSARIVMHNSLRAFELSHLFVSGQARSPDQSVLCAVDGVGEDKGGELLDKAYYADFLSCVREEIRRASVVPRTQRLYALFRRHQEEHSPPQEFVATGTGIYASREVLEIRIGGPLLPRTPVPDELLADLFLFAYTDVIDPAMRGSGFDFFAFSSFIEFCRERRLFRLIALEFGVYIARMTPREFLSVCVSNRGSMDRQPLFADENLSFLRTLFARAIRRYHQLVDFSEIGSMRPSLARFVLSEINRPSVQPAAQLEPFFIPESSIESDLACFVPDAVVQTLDGPLGADRSSLQFSDEQLAGSKLSVVRAVKTFDFRPLFDIGDADDIFDAFRLIGECRAAIGGSLLAKVLRNSRELFLDFAASSVEFRKKLIGLAPRIENEYVLEFALVMIGIKGSTVVIGKDQKKLVYDSELGSPIPSETFSIPVSAHSLLALFVLMYSCASREVGEKLDVRGLLPRFFALRELADELLTICATSCIISPCALRQAVGDFIIDQTFSRCEVTEEAFLEKFPRLFDANLHEEAIRRVACRPARRTRRSQASIDLARVASLAAEQTRFIEALSEEQLVWLIEKAGCASQQAARIESESDDDDEVLEESEGEDISAFSK